MQNTNTQPTTLTEDSFESADGLTFIAQHNGYKIVIMTDEGCSAPDANTSFNAPYVVSGNHRDSNDCMLWEHECYEKGGKWQGSQWYGVAIYELMSDFGTIIKHHKAQRGVAKVRTALAKLIRKARRDEYAYHKEEGYAYDGDAHNDATDASTAAMLFTDFYTEEEAVAFIDSFDELTVMERGVITGYSQGEAANYVRWVNLELLYTMSFKRYSSVYEKSFLPACAEFQALRMLADDAERADLMKYVEQQQKQAEAWFLGHNYGYRVEKLKSCVTCRAESADYEDSCWGYYGFDEVLNEVKSIIE